MLNRIQPPSYVLPDPSMPDYLRGHIEELLHEWQVREGNKDPLTLLANTTFIHNNNWRAENLISIEAARLQQRWTWWVVGRLFALAALSWEAVFWFNLLRG